MYNAEKGGFDLKMDVAKNVKQIASIAILLLGILLIFGNLSGNLGFDNTTQGYTDSETVITDVTTGVTSLSGKFTTVFTILGVLLIIGAIVWMLKMFGFGGKNGNMFG